MLLGDEMLLGDDMLLGDTLLGDSAPSPSNPCLFLGEGVRGESVGDLKALSGEIMLDRL